jgi:hypothetical protein
MSIPARATITKLLNDHHLQHMHATLHPITHFVFVVTEEHSSVLLPRLTMPKRACARNTLKWIDFLFFHEFPNAPFQRQQRPITTKHHTTGNHDVAATEECSSGHLLWQHVTNILQACSAEAFFSHRSSNQLMTSKTPFWFTVIMAHSGGGWGWRFGVFVLRYRIMKYDMRMRLYP